MTHDDMAGIGRAFAIQQLIRLVGPHRAVELVRQADAAHAAGMAPPLEFTGLMGRIRELDCEADVHNQAGAEGEGSKP